MPQGCQRYFIAVQYGQVTVQLQTAIVYMRSSADRQWLVTGLLRRLDKLYRTTVHFHMADNSLSKQINTNDNHLLRPLLQERSGCIAIQPPRKSHEQIC